LNINWKGRGSVKSLPPQLGHCRTPFFSITWSARKRALQDRQSIIGSLNVSSWPLAFHTARFIRIDPSMPTTSSRSCTITRHQ
jgi:hypothetical protein